MSEITKKAKTFADILAIAGVEEKDVIPFKKPKNDFQRGLNAAAKLMLIADVLNEGWEADWNDRTQVKYYPWLYYAGGGSGFSYVVYGCDNLYSYVGSRLVFRTRELAKYAATQFIDIYNEFFQKSK